MTLSAFMISFGVLFVLAGAIFKDRNFFVAGMILSVISIILVFFGK